MMVKWSSFPVAFAIGLSFLAWSAPGWAEAMPDGSNTSHDWEGKRIAAPSPPETPALTGTAWRLVELFGKSVVPAAGAPSPTALSSTRRGTGSRAMAAATASAGPTS